MSFAEIIDDIDSMPLESQEILLDIVNKRLTEKKRQNFIEDTLKSENEYKGGNFLEGNSDNLFKTLNI
jgi:hypothetical protein